jgi:hypothetical protein
MPGTKLLSYQIHCKTRSTTAPTVINSFAKRVPKGTKCINEKAKHAIIQQEFEKALWPTKKKT